MRALDNTNRSQETLVADLLIRISTVWLVVQLSRTCRSETYFQVYVVQLILPAYNLIMSVQMEDNKEKDVFLTVDFLLDSPLR